MYIKKTSVMFDSVRLSNDVLSIIKSNSNHLNIHNALNLITANNRPEQFGCGSLYDYNKKEWIARESDFNIPIERFRGLYIQNVIDRIVEYAGSNHNSSVGRVRLMVLKPKNCLSWHTDVEPQIRFHIPIITNPGAMFIHQDPINEQRVVSLMQDVGALYTFDATVHHTAINASKQPRVHLVACGY